MDQSFVDPLLPKIEVCRAKTAEFIAFLQVYPKPEDVKEFIEGLRAVEKQLVQAYLIKKKLKGYSMLDAEPLDKIFNHLVSLREKFDSLSKSKSLMRAMKSISLRKKLEKQNNDLQREVNKLMRTMNKNLELEEKKRRGKAPQPPPRTPKKEVAEENAWKTPESGSKRKPNVAVGANRKRTAEEPPAPAPASTPTSNSHNDEKTILTFSMERRGWLEKQEELLTRYVGVPAKSSSEDGDTQYGSVITDESNAREQAKRNIPTTTTTTTPPPESGHYSKVERVSAATNGHDKPAKRTPSPGTSPKDEGSHYDRIGALGPAKPLRASAPKSPIKTNYTDLPPTQPQPTYTYSVISPHEPAPQQQPTSPRHKKPQSPKTPLNSYEAFVVESSAYDPVPDDDDDEPTSGSDDDEGFISYGPYELQAQEATDSPWTLIDDPDGVELWKNFDHGSQFYVDWDDFERVFVQKVGRTSLSDTERRVLQHIMDNSGTGGVSAYKFSEFLKGFGPLKQCLENVVKILTQKWFHGFLSRSEADRLLKAEDIGTYLVRFSITRPGSFALALVAKNKSIAHILIERNFPNPGVKVEEVKKGQKTVKVFDSLFEVLQYYYSRGLKTPFISSFLQKPWFHGELTSEEAVQILLGEEVGTFLVRFSNQDGNFATSYVGKNKKVSHSRIEKTPGGFKDVQTGNIWPSLEDMVCKCALTLRTPLPNSRTDIYVFQEDLNSSGETKVDNYQGLNEDIEDSDDGGSDQDNNNNNDNNDNGHYTSLNNDKGKNTKNNNNNKRNYAPLPSEEDIGVSASGEKEEKKSPSNGKHRTPRSPAPSQRPASDNYGIMDYEM